MKASRFLLFVFAAVLLVTAVTAFARPGRISYAGGDGSSLEKAVVIKGATEETGVHAEYEYLEKHFPGYKRGGQSLQNTNGHAYDLLEFTTSAGKKQTIYFDITEFYGK